MGYPYGAGPTAGAFSYSTDQGGGGMDWMSGPRAVPMPHILSKPGVVEGSRLVATLGPVPAGQGWHIQRLTVSCSTAAVAYVYVGGRQPQHLVTGTPAGAFDEHDAARMIPVRQGESMYVVWEGSNLATANAWARIEHWQVDA